MTRRIALCPSQSAGKVGSGRLASAETEYPSMWNPNSTAQSGSCTSVPMSQLYGASGIGETRDSTKAPQSQSQRLFDQKVKGQLQLGDTLRVAYPFSMTNFRITCSSECSWGKQQAGEAKGHVPTAGNYVVLKIRNQQVPERIHHNASLPSKHAQQTCSHAVVAPKRRPWGGASASSRTQAQ